MPTAFLIDLDAIRDAQRRIADHVHRTPMFGSKTLGACIGARVFLKCESFQKTGSFKPRGAMNIVLGLSATQRERGLVTVSAGNHAQAVAWAAARARCPCTVVMPTDAPAAKQDAVRGYGATIVLHPDRTTLFDKLAEVRDAIGATFVHPFDDPVGLAGAGTVGLEIMDQVPEVDVVVVPVGGGGLMAGVTCAVKALRPKCRVIAVELAEGPGLGPALAAGKPVSVARPHTLADGLTPPFVGERPLAIAQALVDDVVGVTEAQIRAAMRFLMERCKLVVEGAGAAATAALLAGVARVPAGASVVAIVSGGNLDLSRLGEIAEAEASA